MTIKGQLQHVAISYNN